MEAVSSVFAAFGITEFDALNDLAEWLDGRVEPNGAADGSARDRGGRPARRSSGAEG